MPRECLFVEVQKAVRDTAKREKKKEKDAETARRREEKKQKAALDKKNSEAAAGAGAAGGKDGNRFWEMIFGDADRVQSCKVGTPIDLKKWDVFFEPMRFTDAVAGKASLFLQQYAGSAAGRSGRCFLCVGDSDTQLHAFYMDLVKRSKPITLRADCERIFRSMFVGVGAAQLSFHMTDAAVLLEGEVYMRDAHE